LYRVAPTTPGLLPTLVLELCITSDFIRWQTDKRFHCRVTLSWDEGFNQFYEVLFSSVYESIKIKQNQSGSAFCTRGGSYKSLKAVFSY